MFAYVMHMYCRCHARVLQVQTAQAVQPSKPFGLLRTVFKKELSQIQFSDSYFRFTFEIESSRKQQPASAKHDSEVRVSIETLFVGSRQNEIFQKSQLPLLTQPIMYSRNLPCWRTEAEFTQPMPSFLGSSLYCLAHLQS